ncbi:TlpA disulfide reductase family protein [Seonamhaeicola sp.]|uniref:TlpA disulfide reductase family protein n=1 Tax=Seonamhaeicola sp. TaxID=1912245 RepID=UPI00260256D8|nr:TlpA disulfide reductase family protein [Seonamhaeicola sp.]
MKLTGILKALLVIILINSCKEKSLETGKYRIDGTAIGLQNGQIFIDKNTGVDTVKIKNGKFRIEAHTDDPVSQLYLKKERLYGSGTNPETNLHLFIEPTIVKLTLNYNDFSKSKLIGSKTQDDNYKLINMLEIIRNKYKDEADEVDRIRKSYYNEAMNGASKEKLDSIKDKSYRAEQKIYAMQAEQQIAIMMFIKENPKSFVSMYQMLFMIRSMKYGEARSIYDNFDPLYKNSELGKRLLNSIEDMQKGIPGTEAKNFNTIDIYGNSIKLADFKGKYLLIDFWASWCVPCRKGNPHLISLYNKYHSKGLEILGVASDDNAPDAWRKAVKDDKIDIWHHVLRGLKKVNGKIDYKDVSTDICKHYNISTLPTKILIDPEGIIIGRYGSGGGTDDDMDRYLADLFD